MKKLFHIFTLTFFTYIAACSAAAFGADSPYWGVTVSTAAGTASGHISGTFKVAASSQTASTATIILDGMTGNISATSMTITGSALMGWETISNACTNSYTCDATCPAGKTIIAGGCYWNNGSWIPAGSYPASNITWRCLDVYHIDMTAYAICARIGN